MSHLIVHAGFPKTGTTALQSFLYTNRELLQRECCIVYPETIFSYDGAMKENGSFLIRYLGGESFEEKEPYLNLLKDALSGSASVLISNETFIWPLFARDGRVFNPFMELLESLGTESISFIFYVRRQDEWFESSWKQEVSTSNTKLDFRTFLRERSRLPVADYYRCFEQLSTKCELPHKIVVRPYNRDLFFGGDIFRDFCHALEIPWNDAFVLPPQDDSNLSTSLSVTEAMRGFWPLSNFTDDVRHGVFVPFEAELSKRYPDDPLATMFTATTRRKCLAPFEKSNALLAEKYLGGVSLVHDSKDHMLTWKADKERIRTIQKELETKLNDSQKRSYALWRVQQSLIYIPRVLVRELREGARQVLQNTRIR